MATADGLQDLMERHNHDFTKGEMHRLGAALKLVLRSAGEKPRNIRHVYKRFHEEAELNEAKGGIVT